MDSSLPVGDSANRPSCQRKERKKRHRKRKSVRTLYVTGLPTDSKPREVYLAFRTCPGYERSILLTRTSTKGPSPVAFVTFKTREEAKSAQEKLRGERIDPEKPMQMYIEFAREDTKNEQLVEKDADHNLKDDHKLCSIKCTKKCNCPPAETAAHEQLGLTTGTFAEGEKADFHGVVPFPPPPPFPPYLCSYYPFFLWPQPVPCAYGYLPTFQQ